MELLNFQNPYDSKHDVQSNEQTMSSLQIAELTGTPHNDVLKSIRKMEPAWSKVSQGNFSLAEYIDAQGKPRPMYNLTKTECLYVATKFNDEARAKLVIRWEELENKQAIDFSDANAVLILAQNWAEEQNRRIEAEKTVAILTHIQKTYTITEIAKELGLKSAITLNIILKEKGIQFKQNDTWVPYSKYSNLGWFDIKQEVLDSGRIIYHRRITGIGRENILKLLKHE